MSNTVKIATFATRCVVEESMSYDQMADACITFWAEKFARILPDRPDLIVMPECSNRPGEGLTKENELAYYDVANQRTLAFAAEAARKNRCNIVCSQARHLDAQWYNTSTIFGRDGGELGCYRKNFLVPSEHTNNKMAYGTEANLIETDFGKVACAICFDLNFDDLREHYRSQSPDLIVFSSNYHGGIQQQIWPWLCRCHIVGSLGYRENAGQIRNPFGQVVHTTTNYLDHVCGSVNLDCQIVHLDDHWEKLDALKCKFGPDVTVYDPGEYGCVLVTSQSPDTTAREMIEEFEIIDYDEYLRVSRKQRSDVLSKE
jgi:predicted amidohydrolase